MNLPDWIGPGVVLVSLLFILPSTASAWTAGEGCHSGSNDPACFPWLFPDETSYVGKVVLVAAVIHAGIGLWLVSEIVKEERQRRDDAWRPKGSYRRGAGHHLIRPATRRDKQGRDLCRGAPVTSLRGRVNTGGRGCRQLSLAGRINDPQEITLNEGSWRTRLAPPVALAVFMW